RRSCVMAEVTLEAAPRKARDLFDKGFAAMERGNLDYAVAMFEAALDIEPRLLRARKFMRAAEIKRRQAGGGGALARGLTVLTHLPALLSAQAKLKKRPEEALRASEKLLKADPLQILFINLHAQAAVAAGLPEVAVLTLEYAHEYDSKNIELLRWLGRLYRDNNQTQESRRCFEEAAQLKPNDPDTIKDLKDAVALDSMQKGGWSDSATDVHELVKDKGAAQLLEQTGRDLDDLIAEAQGKIQQEPENINYRRLLADYLARANRFDEALAGLREAQTSMGRTDPQVDRAIGSLVIQKFEYEIEQLRAGAKTAEAAAQEQSLREFIFQNARELVARYPNDLQFRYDLGVLLFERGQITEAIEEFQIAQRNPQRRARALFFLALCFKQKGQFDIALEQLDKSLEELGPMDDTKKDVIYEMGLLQEAMGHPAKAVERFKEIYAVDIRYKDVAQRMEQAYKK
ncbi:MAG: tetratricopeptide repeat protein, partial [Kiritimatiellaeota bacterium]|nr:tetratricopeptide repeat protein [Kiritimatiellota bacterium]